MFLLLFSFNTFKVTICDLKNKDRKIAYLLRIITEKFFIFNTTITTRILII